MYAGEVIAVAFIAMLLVALPLERLEKRELLGPAKVFLAVGVFSGVYSILAGIHLAGGWEDPFANVDAERLGSASAKGRGRGGLVILAIRSWPYILMGTTMASRRWPIACWR